MDGGAMLAALEGEEMEEEDMPAPGGDNGMMHDEEELVPHTDESKPSSSRMEMKAVEM